ncbi:MAG: hypothetical protein J6D13_09615, partial [Clostridium sp.]|nr:hypothetical protein [Clostridium sp.]
RVMGYEYASYEEQIKERMAKNKAEKKPAVIARLHEYQKLAPVITTVVNWSGEEWRGPRSLHDMLEFPPEIEEEIRPLVADYPIHLLEWRCRRCRRRYETAFSRISGFWRNMRPAGQNRGSGKDL